MPFSSSHSCHQGSSISSLLRDVSQLEAKLQTLSIENLEVRKALIKLAERLLKANLLGADDRTWIAELIGEHAGGDCLEKAAARAAHRVLGKVRCKCGATVDDVDGVVDERCPWCGEKLTTDR